MIVGLFVAPALAVGCLLLGMQLYVTHRELKRVRRRMGRLDAIADDLASQELLADPTADADSETRGARQTPSRERRETPVQTPLRDSGSFTPIMGLRVDTDEIEDEEFAAPRMAPEEHPPAQQIPSRRRHETPVGSPRNLTPPARESLMSVGSISIRSDHVSPQNADE